MLSQPLLRKTLTRKEGAAARKTLLSDPKYVEQLERIRETALMPSDVRRAKEGQPIAKCQVPVPADAADAEKPPVTLVDLNAFLTFEGQTYQCVEIFGRSQEPQGAYRLARRGVGLVRVPMP